jgi:hypothetical protein
MIVFGLIAATLIAFEGYRMSRDGSLLAAAVPFLFGLGCMAYFGFLLVRGV